MSDTPPECWRKFFDCALERILDALEAPLVEKFLVGQPVRDKPAFFHFDERDPGLADFVDDRVMRVVVAIDTERFLVLPDIGFVERQMQLFQRRAAAPGAFHPRLRVSARAATARVQAARSSRAL